MILNPKACVASSKSDWVLTITCLSNGTPAIGTKCEKIVNAK